MLEIFGENCMGGTCSECRHANQNTEDAAEGFWACPWLGAVNSNLCCQVKFVDTGKEAFEVYDGTNGTWNTQDGFFRRIPQGYENRKVEAKLCDFDLDEWLSQFADN